ncbi:MAG: Type 1 glutamine amidotransferase-like domain-containing protein [Patescibacteria group bacterium]|nr:Type 1 glutamine amidotransferase-like domain-containing protein [Patescibacteria group bacterium]
MKKIVAIGGGEIGSPGYPVETAKIDKEIIRLAGKKNPVVLFIPTASSDSPGYYETVRRHFGRRLGCKVDVLLVIKEKPSRAEIERKVMSSDIIYVGGGNTFKMIRAWKACGLDIILKKAWNKGIVLSGLSAGSICWFRNGISDSRRFKNPEADLIKVSGLGFIPATNSPHYDVEKDRRAGLKKIMRKTPNVAIAIDNCCAVEFVEDTYRVIASKPGAKAYKVYWKMGKYHNEEIPRRKEFASISDLLAR